jgi:hypothetical protein
MSLALRITMFVFSFLLAIITLMVLRKGRIPIKYSLLWFFSSFIILCVAIFPNLLELLASTLGFATISNLVIGIITAILLFLTMSLTIITSGQRKKITLLIQEVSILKEKVNSNEKD